MVGLRLTSGDSGITTGDESIFSSSGVGSGVGDWIWMVEEKGALWGNGEISIESTSGHGDEDTGTGGVWIGTFLPVSMLEVQRVIASIPLQLRFSKTLALKSDLLGVGGWGLSTVNNCIWQVDIAQQPFVDVEVARQIHGQAGGG